MKDSSSSNINNLPLGWGDRNNQMSEHDQQLGGLAANRFASKKKSVYDGEDTNIMSYKTDDQIREFYLNNNKNDDEQQTEGKATTTPQTKSKSSSASPKLPDLWETRQKERDLQAKQMGAFSSRHQEPKKTIQIQTQTSSSTTTYSSHNNDDHDDGDMLLPEVALVQITTNALKTMAKALQTNNGNSNRVKIPMEERTEFAEAMKQAMDALAKQSM